MATIARLNGGRTAKDIAKTGYAVRLQVARPDGGAYVVVGSSSGSPLTAKSLRIDDLQPLVNAGIISSPKDVLSQSSDPLLASCDYTLAERPAALPYLQAAEQAGFAHGLIKPSDLPNLGVRIISDDPYSKDDVLVTLQIGTRPKPIGAPGTPVLMSDYDVVAVVDKSSFKVLAIADGNWY